MSNKPEKRYDIAAIEGGVFVGCPVTFVTKEGARIRTSAVEQLIVGNVPGYTVFDTKNTRYTLVKAG